MTQQKRRLHDETLHQCFADDIDRDEAEKRSIPSMDPFISSNERPVDDISLKFFYKPHTVTLLAVSIIAVMYFAFVRYVIKTLKKNHSIFYEKKKIIIMNEMKGMIA